MFSSICRVTSGCAGAPLLVENLMTLVLGRVMAGSHVDATDCLAGADGVGDHRGGSVAFTEQGDKAIG
jgi:hypothetical protein